MNREQKRQYVKTLKKKGFMQPQIDSLMKVYETKMFFKEGEKVRLNIKSIEKDTNYAKLTQKYKDFIHNNADKIFTVEYDTKHQNNPAMVCLAEDETDPKWLFWEGNLERVEG